MNTKQDASQKSRPERKSSLSPEELKRLSGADPVVEWLVKKGLPVTLQGYLDVGMDGAKWADLDGEQRDTVPRALWPESDSDE